MIASRAHPRSRSRRWRGTALGALLAATLLWGCGGGASSTTSSSPARTRPATTPAAADLVARLRAPGHSPKVGRPWPITVTLSWRGRAARGHVSYEFLLGGQVVSRQPVKFESPNFTGTFHDDIQWPADAVDFNLTFRVVVSSAHGTKRLDYPVRVTR